MSAQELLRVVDLLAGQVGHWTPQHWAGPAAAPEVTRAELVHNLVQRLADLAAEAEGQPRRTVPRLDSDLALPDQLRVVATDLADSGAPDLLTHAAAADVAEVRARLTAYRHRPAGPADPRPLTHRAG